MLKDRKLPKKSTRIWVASHVTALFAPSVSTLPSSSFTNWRDTLHVGSLGLGFSMDVGVITEVQEIRGSSSHQHQIWFDDVEVPFEKARLSIRALKLLESEIGKLPGMRVRHYFEVPIGGGFGTSAAGVLGLLITVRNKWQLPLDDLELFQMAHGIEILEKGGLGDVLALYHGGFEQRVKVGGPGVGTCRQFEEVEKKINVLIKHFSGLETKSVLADERKMAKLKEVGTKFLNSFTRLHHLDLDLLKKGLQEFDDVLSVMNSEVAAELQWLWEEGYVAGQIMIGNGVFVLLEASIKANDEKIRILKDRGYHLHQIVKETVRGV